MNLYDCFLKIIDKTKRIEKNLLMLYYNSIKPYMHNEIKVIEKKYPETALIFVRIMKVYNLDIFF